MPKKELIVVAVVVTQIKVRQLFLKICITRKTNSTLTAANVARCHALRLQSARNCLYSSTEQTVPINNIYKDFMVAFVLLWSKSYRKPGCTIIIPVAYMEIHLLIVQKPQLVAVTKKSDVWVKNNFGGPVIFNKTRLFVCVVKNSLI